MLRTEREILIDSLKTNEYVRFREMTEPQKVLIEAANEEQMVQYQYGRVWYNPQETMGNRVSLLGDGLYRLNPEYTE